jgi:putative mRNA 3-end processing factor
MEHPEALREPGELEAAWRWCRRVSSKSDKKKALEADVIVTTSGMLEGGPALWYLNRLRHDNKNAILQTGYQASETGGRMLQDKGQLRIFGKMTEVPLELDQFSFSTHAGHKEIVEFAQACQAEEVVVYHTDPTHARPPLVEALEANGHIVHTPENGISEFIGEEYSRSN